MKQKTQFALKSTCDSLWGSFLTWCCRFCCFSCCFCCHYFRFVLSSKNIPTEILISSKNLFFLFSEKNDFGCCQIMMTYWISETTQLDRISFYCRCLYFGHFSPSLKKFHEWEILPPTGKKSHFALKIYNIRMRPLNWTFLIKLSNSDNNIFVWFKLVIYFYRY